MGVIVQIDPAGRVSVRSTVPNVALALGLLEIAKAELLKQTGKASAVEVPSAEVAQHLLNGHGG